MPSVGGLFAPSEGKVFDARVTVDPDAPTYRIRTGCRCPGIRRIRNRGCACGVKGGPGRRRRCTTSILQAL